METVSIALEKGDVKLSVTGSPRGIRELFPDVLHVANAIAAANTTPEIESRNYRLSFQDDELGQNESEAASASSGESFGELFSGLQPEISDSDLVLVAAEYAERETDDGTFTTRRVSDLLEGQRIRVSNASQYIRRHMSAKRVFAASEKGKYKVSRSGIDYLNDLKEGRKD